MPRLPACSNTSVASMLHTSEWSAGGTNEGLSRADHFLGIDDEISAIYDSPNLAEQRTLRWAQIGNRMKEMSRKLHYRFLIVEDERLAQNSGQGVAVAQEFLGLSTSIPEPLVNRGSLQKWRHLDDSTMRDIDRVLRRASNEL